MTILLRLLIITLAVLLAAYTVPGITVDGFAAALIVAVVLGLLNLTVKPILFVLTLPIQIITLGLFMIIINAGILYFVANILEGIEIVGFVPAIIGAIIISIVSWIGNKLI